MIKKMFAMLAKPRKLGNYFLELRNMKRLTGMSYAALAAYSVRLGLSTGFHGYMSKMKRAAAAADGPLEVGGWIDLIQGFAIYAVIRHRKPAVIVETGVGPGSTSAFILKALNDNRSGKLYSIDLPGNDAIEYPKLGKSFQVHVPDGFRTGWLVSPELKKRWNLIIGDSKKELPALLAKLGNIDIFLHDSLHTDEHILFEFNTAWPYLDGKSILLCDDVNTNWSLAFIDFCKNKALPYIVFNGRLGIAKVVNGGKKNE